MPSTLKKTQMIHARIDPKLKKSAERIFNENWYLENRSHSSVSEASGVAQGSSVSDFDTECEDRGGHDGDYMMRLR